MFAKNDNGSFKRISGVTKPTADTPRNPYKGDYGSRVPLGMMALINGKWQRVYLDFHPAHSQMWVQVKGARVMFEEREAETPLEHYQLNLIFFNFVMGYTAALQWSTSGNDRKGRELESLEGYNFHRDAFALILADCWGFYSANRDDILEAANLYQRPDGGNKYGYAGHDFWLTRAGHGAGFWDGDLPQALGERLTAASKAMGEREAYVNDDNLIHLMGE